MTLLPHRSQREGETAGAALHVAGVFAQYHREIERERPGVVGD